MIEEGLRRGFTKGQVAAALRQWTDDDLVVLAAIQKWANERHEGQWIPSDDWAECWVLAGRGWGKTRFGAEWSWQSAAMYPRDVKQKYRGLVAAPTNADLSGVCFDGDSGLLACIPPSLIRNYVKTPRPQIVLHNGAKIMGIAAERPSRFRGPQFHRAWLDEVAAWGDNGKDPQEVWDMIAFGVRLGTDTRVLVTTTPRPLPLIKERIKSPGVMVIGGPTHQNLKNLSPEFRKRILTYDGTKIGRQEIYAEILDNEDDGIIKRSDLRLWPHDKPLPVFDLVVMSLDTAFSEESYDKKKRVTDPSACSVWGCFKYLPEKVQPGVKPRPLFGIMLLDCWAEKLGFPDLVDKVKLEIKAKYGADEARPQITPLRGPSMPEGSGHGIDLIVIEEKASGKSLRQQLFKDGILTRGYNPGKADKLTRLHIVSPLATHGILWVPESPSKPGKTITWANDLIDQFCTFSGEGTVLHDDLLDTTTQALRVIDDIWLHYLREANKRPLPGDDLVDPIAKKRNNPYAS